MCSTMVRATSRPRPSTMQTAWSSRAQSIPAVTSLTGSSGRVLLADFTSASSLLVPVGRHPHVVPQVPGRGCRFAH